ncbi:hypothetical protein K501DRAFT_257765 [Backusella circina FSU 941]|nr:hypothetical protein K501DRAFT_257765 [Backusella circina FSU 941]
MSSCTYRFISSSHAELPSDRDYALILRQQPDRAKVHVLNERERRTIEPPPIIQMNWINMLVEDEKKYLQSPFYFMVANLVMADNPTPLLSTQEYFSGSTVSSLYRLRDTDNNDAGFFVFGDLAVKKQGRFRLHFSLFELVDGAIQNRKTMLSDVFTVYSSKQYPGPMESTFLSRAFSDQGVKMKVRKEHRLQSTNNRKRKLEQGHSLNNDNNNSRDDHHRLFKPRVVPSPSYASENVHFGRWQSKMTVNNSSNNNSDSKTAVLSPLTSVESTPPEQSIDWSPNTMDNMPDWNNRLPPLHCVIKPEIMYSPLPLDRSFFSQN